MTFVSVIGIGVGILLIASSLDNSSITSTFLKIVNGEAIDWTGQQKIDQYASTHSTGTSGRTGLQPASTIIPSGTGRAFL
ncbi:MAG TPA: hypothetical protein VFK47_18210 [Ktedonobacteraceae bacterium]|nr:hypothetical protein [Ktedonobacteraceae bacterium]